jgi:hypothetical protein
LCEGEAKLGNYIFYQNLAGLTHINRMPLPLGVTAGINKFWLTMRGKAGWFAKTPLPKS